jgi:hypothetical protein
MPSMLLKTLSLFYPPTIVADMTAYSLTPEHTRIRFTNTTIDRQTPPNLIKASSIAHRLIDP